MRRGCFVSCLLTAVIVVGLSPCICFGELVYTDKIDLGFLFNTWYDNTNPSPIEGSINFNNTAITASQSFLSTFSNIGSDNILEVTGEFTFISELTSDYSSGGIAKGIFAGGATISFVGGIKQGGVYVYGGTGNDANQILQATLKPAYNGGWSLEEEALVQGAFNRTLDIELDTTVGLGAGVTFEYETATYTLKLAANSEYPKMGLELKTASTVNDFGVDINSGWLASHIKINSVVPEPATLVLVGAGMVLLRKRENE
ncbi:MAG: PEP-CTERM sorting domain-containing protein [Anaerohalosphaeraceae bacterium]|nr:PEP-CTERM sorting domain-containing protein [Anaerohalosphaeraceae bacterium]